MGKTGKIFSIRRFVLVFVAAALVSLTKTSINKLASDKTTTDAISTTIRDKAEKMKTPERITTAARASYLSASKKISVPAASSAANNLATSAKTMTSYITINGTSVPIFVSGNTTTDAGRSVALYNGRFLYGHRGTAFGQIASLPAGATFEVTLNGATSTYVVVNSTTLDKDTTARFMNAFANEASYKGNYYDLVLMTCAGTPGAGGDATHRAVVFANRM